MKSYQSRLSRLKLNVSLSVSSILSASALALPFSQVHLKSVELKFTFATTHQIYHPKQKFAQFENILAKRKYFPPTWCVVKYSRLLIPLCILLHSLKFRVEMSVRRRQNLATWGRMVPCRMLSPPGLWVLQATREAPSHKSWSLGIILMP